MNDLRSMLGTVRFGVFELDLAAGELRKRGVKLKLQETTLPNSSASYSRR